jgi:hypothetical protein
MRPTLLFAGLVILFSLLLMSQESAATKLAKPNAEIQKNFVLELEFLEDNPRTTSLFNSFGDSVGQAVEHFKMSTKIDFIFLILYPSFLFLFGKNYGNLSGRKLQLSAVFCVIMSLGDLGENLQLLGILNNYSGEDFSMFFPKLKLFTWLKWGAISVFFLVIAQAFWKMEHWGFKVLAGLFVISFLLGICSFFGIISPIQYAQTVALNIFLTLILVISWGFKTWKNRNLLAF